MPVESCHDKGQPGYRWGKQGKCYVYDPKDQATREWAMRQANKQGRAVEADKKKGKK